jgi:hypothetical protein
MNHTVSLDDMQMPDEHLGMIKGQSELLSWGAKERAVPLRGELSPSMRMDSRWNTQSASLI